jgi:hypothetical protein
LQYWRLSLPQRTPARSTVPESYPTNARQPANGSWRSEELRCFSPRRHDERRTTTDDPSPWVVAGCAVFLVGSTPAPVSALQRCVSVAQDAIGLFFLWCCYLTSYVILLVLFTKLIARNLQAAYFVRKKGRFLRSLKFRTPGHLQ